jgi:hypothetical protein
MSVSVSVVVLCTMYNMLVSKCVLADGSRSRSDDCRDVYYLCSNEFN